MTTKCDLCARIVPDMAIAVVRVNAEELCTEKPISDEFTVTVCYDCLPTLGEWLKKAVLKAELIALSDVVWKY